jgi:hypothetical protein
VISRWIQAVLGILGVIALALAIWSGLDGDWWPLIVLMPGVGAYGFGILRRA